mmetsp:Transcript_9888/g.23428  ORF Transcript_9888/g.23428 Transcript_9888/m.23428 type:complete len:208 (-) Transcript_9888:380-1003(-)
MYRRPRSSVEVSESDDLLITEKMATPRVISKASMYCVQGYEAPLRILPMIMTGMILDDLKTVWTGKDTYRSDAYCDQDEPVLLNAQGVKAMRGAVLLARTAPCLSLTAMMATMMARKRLEKTQKAAEGNRPSGAESVGLNTVVMMSSCMYPHVRYDACRPQKQKANLIACAQNSAVFLASSAFAFSSLPMGTSDPPEAFPSTMSGCI